LTATTSSLLLALDLAEAAAAPPSLDLQRRAQYRPVGAFAIQPGRRTPQSRAQVRSGGGGESNDDDDDDDSTSSDPVRRSSSIFHIPVANLVIEGNEETNLSSSVSALTSNTTTAAAQPPPPPPQPTSAIITAVDIETVQEVYSGTLLPRASSQSDLDGSERATKPNDNETSARNGPYCSRLFYTLLCLALLVLIIVFIVLGITILKNGGPKPDIDPMPPPPPRIPPPTLSPVVSSPASINNNTTTGTNTTDSA
jgi:hypothetical protein